MANKLAQEFPNADTLEFGLALDEARKYLKQFKCSNNSDDEEVTKKLEKAFLTKQPKKEVKLIQQKEANNKRPKLCSNIAD